MTTPNKPTTAKTILCRYCGHSIKRVPYTDRPPHQRWIHNWTGLKACGFGRATEAEPRETSQ